MNYLMIGLGILAVVAIGMCLFFSAAHREDVVGIKLMDALGATYIKTQKEGLYKQGAGVSSDLIELGNKLDDMSLYDAICYCERMTNGICYEILYRNE